MSNMIKADDLGKLSTTAVLHILQEQFELQLSLLSLLSERYRSRSDIRVGGHHVNDFIGAVHEKTRECRSYMNDVENVLNRRPLSLEIR